MSIIVSFQLSRYHKYNVGIYLDYYFVILQIAAEKHQNVEVGTDAEITLDGNSGVYSWSRSAELTADQNLHIRNVRRFYFFFYFFKYLFSVFFWISTCAPILRAF